MIRKLELTLGLVVVATLVAPLLAGCSGSQTSPDDIPKETKLPSNNPEQDKGPLPKDYDMVPGPKKPGMQGGQAPPAAAPTTTTGG